MDIEVGAYDYMKKYVKLGLGVAGFVVFLAVVSLLYGKLSEDYKPEQNLVVENTAEVSDDEVADYISESVESEETEIGADESTNTTEEQQSNLAIDFSMKNVAGESVSLFDFVGKPIVLNFWASWCDPCKAEIPDFQEAYEKYDDEIYFLMVNMTDGAQETKETAMTFIEEQGYSLPFYFDTQLQGTYTYGVYSLPTTFFINAKGEMVAYAQGMIDGETLEQGISMIYGEN